MKFIKLDSKDPYYNLAVEEYLFRYTNDDVFMLWQNDKTVVVGKNQNVYTEVNLDYVRNNDIKIARRITGGGAVYHDLGNINYSYISCSNKSTGVDFLPFVAPVIDALREFNVDCTLSGRNDLLVNDKKISGNAQYSAGGRTLHHGTLLFNSDLSVMPHVLNYNREKYDYKAVKSHTGRVANVRDLLSIDISTVEFCDLIESKIVKSLNLERVEQKTNQQIEVLRCRNISDEWIYATKRMLTDYSFKRTKRLSCGVLTMELKLNKEVIDDVKISGDFFEVQSVSLLEDRLRGMNLNDLSGIGVDRYIYNLNDEDFVGLIKE